MIRLLNDEGEVRTAAQAALDRAVASGRWASAADQRCESPIAFASFDEFEQRTMRPTFADHGIDEAMVERVRLRYLPQPPRQLQHPADAPTRGDAGDERSLPMGTPSDVHVGAHGSDGCSGEVASRRRCRALACAAGRAFGQGGH